MTRAIRQRPVGALLIAVAILSLPNRASAEERAYSARGAAHFVSPTEFVGAGQATHLGEYTEAGCATFSGTDVPWILQIDARAHYTAANGDVLCATITGQLNGLTGEITATVTYVGGTGRFVDATGSATLSGQFHDGTISVTVQGTINY
jgi:hypothetical protein